MTKEIIAKDLTFSEINELFPPVEDESRYIIGCSRADYSASAIARAVEDCNAQVLNLNVTALPSEDYDLVIFLRVNHRSTEAITRSLERYGYSVLQAHSSSEQVNEQMLDRVNELLRYLEI